MKIKKIKLLSNKLVKLQTLKLYLKKNFSNIQTHLNKIANIIYKFHTTNKKILFLGFPANFRNNLKNTKHIIIPEFLSFNGILSNKESINKITKTKVKKFSIYALKLLLKIKKIDLIIIYNQKNQSTAIQESYIARIPTITLCKKLNFNNKTAYQSLGKYETLNEKDKNNNFFLSFLKSIINRAKKEKNFKQRKPFKNSNNFYEKKKRKLQKRI
jgi:ribosomal protein S2